MESRKLLNHSKSFSPMGFGAWAIGGELTAPDGQIGWGPVDDNESKAAILTAFESGITFFDTADIYGAGHSEKIVGETLKPIRDQVTIATKFGITFAEGKRLLTGTCCTPDYIQIACEASLRRLQTDHIDLYQFHLNDFDPSQIDDILEKLEQLVDQGKIRAYGWSTDFIDRATAFSKGKHNATVQFQNNVIQPNAPMMQFCETHQLMGINRGPLAMGLLTGKYKVDSVIGEGDVRGKSAPSWMSYFKDGKPNPEWLSKVEKVREILRSNGRTLTQGALAWLWAASPQNQPIPGIRTVAQAKENAGAMAFGPLTETQLSEISLILGY